MIDVLKSDSFQIQNAVANYRKNNRNSKSIYIKTQSTIEEEDNLDERFSQASSRNPGVTMPV